MAKEALTKAEANSLFRLINEMPVGADTLLDDEGVDGYALLDKLKRMSR